MFRELLVKYMEINGISQMDLSKKIGTSQQSVSDFLTSEGNPQKRTREKYFKNLLGFEDFYVQNTRKNEFQKSTLTNYIDTLKNCPPDIIVTHIFDDLEKFKNTLSFQLLIDGLFKDRVIEGLSKIKDEKKRELLKQAIQK